jgi:hypothetical protein
VVCLIIPVTSETCTIYEILSFHGSEDEDYGGGGDNDDDDDDDNDDDDILGFGTM